MGRAVFGGQGFGPQKVRIPLWRFGLGMAVLGSLIAVLFALGPVYLDDFRLKKYVKTLATRSDIKTTSDEQIRASILAEARKLDLPVHAGDVTISHSATKTLIDIRYISTIDYSLYNVDLHFHSSAP